MKTQKNLKISITELWTSKHKMNAFVWSSQITDFGPIQNLGRVERCQWARRHTNLTKSDLFCQVTWNSRKFSKSLVEEYLQWSKSYSLQEFLTKMYLLSWHLGSRHHFSNANWLKTRFILNWCQIIINSMPPLPTREHT